MVAMNQHNNGRERGTSRCVRSIVLGWTDRESGEEVVIDVRGAAGLLEGIEAQGFVVLREESAPLVGSEDRTVDGAEARKRDAAANSAERSEPNRVEPGVALRVGRSKLDSRPTVRSSTGG